MADHYTESNGEAGDNTGEGRSGGSRNGTPRWVKIFGTLLILAILLFVIMLFAGGPHGPSRHLRPGAGSPTPSAERVAQ